MEQSWQWPVQHVWLCHQQESPRTNMLQMQELARGGQTHTCSLMPCHKLASSPQCRSAHPFYFFSHNLKNSHKAALHWQKRFSVSLYVFIYARLLFFFVFRKKKSHPVICWIVLLKVIPYTLLSFGSGA